MDANVLFKNPRRKGRSISTQNIATMLVQLLQTSAKRYQYFNASFCNKFGHVWLPCSVVRYWYCKQNLCTCPGATSLHDQTSTTSCNIHKCCMKNMTIFKYEPTIPYISQKSHNRVANRVQHVAANNTPICFSQLTFRKRVITFSVFVFTAHKVIKRQGQRHSILITQSLECDVTLTSDPHK